MTRLQRMENVAAAVILVLLSVLLIYFPDKGYMMVFLFVSFSWLIKSVRLLIYYFSMARYMVDGQRVLLKGVVFFDLAILS